jgi:hypothetical protein
MEAYVHKRAPVRILVFRCAEVRGRAQCRDNEMAVWSRRRLGSAEKEFPCKQRKHDYQDWNNPRHQHCAFCVTAPALPGSSPSRSNLGRPSAAATYSLLLRLSRGIDLDQREPGRSGRRAGAHLINAWPR